jgi:hypothetical protein
MIDYETLFQRAQQARHFFDPTADQINGEDHPDYHAIHAQPDDARALIAAIGDVCHQRGVRIIQGQNMTHYGGHYSPHERTIVMNPDLPRPLYTVTLLHEFCHSADPDLPPATIFDHYFVNPIVPRNEAATIAAQTLLADRYGIDCMRHAAVMLTLRLWELEDRGADPDLPTIRSRATDIYEAGRTLLDPLLTERIAA